MKSWRFVHSAPDTPYRNMALDEALLRSYLKTKKPVFRIYRWKPFAFSLGYSQNISQVLSVDKCIHHEVPFVRRLTGGTIIYHGPEITYSLVCSDDDLDGPRNVKESFKILCSFILNFYKGLGLKPRFSADRCRRQIRESSFCFGSCQDYDILVNNKKIGGNAQRRIKKVILQHGSIPLSLDFDFSGKFIIEDISRVRENATCLREMIPGNIEIEDLVLRLKDSFAKSFLCDLEETSFLPEELADADRLESEKYRKKEWNLKR